MKLTIESMMYGPDGLAHAEDGKAVFVAGGVAGDVVEAQIVEDGSSFSRATVSEVLEPSPSRVDSPCPFVGVCGGCPWGNLSARHSSPQRKKTCVPRSNALASSMTTLSPSWCSHPRHPR